MEGKKVNDTKENAVKSESLEEQINGDGVGGDTKEITLADQLAEITKQFDSRNEAGLEAAAKETESGSKDAAEKSEETEASEPEEPQKPGRESASGEHKGKGRWKKVALIAALVLALVVLGGYVAGIIYFNGHFYLNTTINQIDFSGKTAAEVEKKLTEEVDNYELKLKERENITETISGKDIDLALVFDGSFQDLLKRQNPFGWIVGLFKESDYSIGSSLQYSQQKMQQVLAGLKASNTVLQIVPVDATIEWNETEQYYINPGTPGTQLDHTVFSAAVKKAVEELENTLDMDKENCYVPQNIDEKDQRLINAVAELNKYSQAVVNYNFNGTIETCSGETIRNWLSLGEDYSVQISAEAAREYIDTLGDKYNTYGTNRTFTTTGGATVEITQGDYGWRMNRADMTDELVAAVREGGSHDKEPLWLQTANSNSAQDWGNTYVEVNLGAQHLYFYKDGQLIVESDLVSGKMSGGRATPSGIYSLKWKEKDRVLRGDKKADGSWGYESFVNFWMPFNGGVGMHDASWRSSFGGSIYINSGSHGCVNLPYSKAKAIYENITAGTPIICFYGSSSSETRDTISDNVVAETASDGGTPSDSGENVQNQEQDAQPQDEPQQDDQSQEQPVEPQTPAEGTEGEQTPGDQPQGTE